MTGAYFSRAQFSRTPYSCSISGIRHQTEIAIPSVVSVECSAYAGGQMALKLSLRPGQVLEVNTDTMEVRLDGQPLLNSYVGLSLAMQPEVTDIYYRDSSNTIGRDLEMTVWYTDRFY